MTTNANVKGSIRQRILMILLAGAVALSVGLFFAFQNFAIRLAEESQDNILRASATAILDAVSVKDGELELDLPYAAFSMLSNDANDRVFYAIHADEDFLTGYQDLPRPLTSSKLPLFRTAEYGQDEVRLVELNRLITSSGVPQRLSVTIAQTRDVQAALLARISNVAASAGALLFVLFVLLAFITERAAVSPVIRITDSVRRRGPNELRAVAAPVPVEMAPLVSALNGFMDRLKTSLSRTEEFIADAAHRVRTPLATVRTHAEATLLRVEKGENRAAMREMIRAIDESSRAAGQMLDHAMVTLRADDLESDTIELTKLAHELVGRLRPLAELRDIELVVVSEGEETIQGDPILVQSALRNLLDNAIKYSAAESQIKILVQRQDDQPTIAILDHGGGFRGEKIEDLTQRFKRGENASGTVGSGLGLTIAADVARAHGGKLELKNNQDQGACATLFFPSY